MPDNESEYGLVMPFVVCASQGGPYDDRAFVAGWECGALDQVLAVLRPYGATINRWVKPELLPQLDLIAMKHSLVMTVGEMHEESGYVNVEFGIGPSAGEVDDAGA